MNTKIILDTKLVGNVQGVFMFHHTSEAIDGAKKKSQGFWRIYTPTAIKLIVYNRLL